MSKPQKKRRKKPNRPKHAFTILDQLGEDVYRKLSEALRKGERNVK